MNYNIKISPGNTKIGKIPNINLPPGRSCRLGVPCLSSGCYALKAYRMYPSTQKAWDQNYYFFINNPDDYFNEIESWLLSKKTQPQYFRWHSSGDIVSQKYLDGMISISNKFNNIKFLAFTKQFDFDFSNIPQNLFIIMSMWPNFIYPQQYKDIFTFSWMDDGTDKRIPQESVYQCPGSCPTCMKCWTKDFKNIVFKKH